MKTYSNHQVSIVRNASNERFARIDNRQVLPLDMLRLAAGKDAWMRQIVFKCSYCSKFDKAENMECGQCCPACFEEAGEENARADGGDEYSQIMEGQGINGN